MNKKNKQSAEYQGNTLPMLYPLKSFADLENLVRLSLSYLPLAETLVGRDIGTLLFVQQIFKAKSSNLKTLDS